MQIDLPTAIAIAGIIASIVWWASSLNSRVERLERRKYLRRKEDRDVYLNDRPNNVVDSSELRRRVSDRVRSDDDSPSGEEAGD
jgi:hypothetical protein